MRIFLLKYFTILKSSVKFILFNLEYDSFLAHINMGLYKMALSNYYNRNNWKNLKNTYDVYLTHSLAFRGEKKIDRLFFFKSIFVYLFIYLNFFFLLNVLVFFFMLKFLFSGALLFYNLFWFKKFFFMENFFLINYFTNFFFFLISIIFLIFINCCFLKFLFLFLFFL